jgi:hypothetical protein
MSMVHTDRGILVRGLTAAFVEEQIQQYEELPGGKGVRHLFSISPCMNRWVLIGVPGLLTTWHFHNLACWLCTTADEPEPYEEIIVVRLLPGKPEAGYYLFGTPDDWRIVDDAVFLGRREDGINLWVDIPGGSIREFEDGRWFQLSLLPFLEGRQVPSAFLPSGEGFSFAPEREVAVNLVPYEPRVAAEPNAAPDRGGI